MTQEQFAQLLQRRRRRPLQPLLASGATQVVLRAAARAVRETDRIADELARILPPDWLARVRVEGWQAGTLELRTAEAALAEQLRRRAPALRQALARRVPGLQRLLVLRD